MAYGNCLAWLASQYIRKGSLLYVEGKLRNRQYEDKQGQKKYVTEVVAEQVVLLDKKTKLQPDETGEITEDPLPF